jgi:antitoxin HicB
MNDLRYPMTVRQLAEDEGGGYLVEFPDLPGCMADGETVEEAIEAGREAVAAWLATAAELGRSLPEPGTAATFSGRWVQRVPKSLHARLAARARIEGVSLNTFVTSVLAEAVGDPRRRRAGSLAARGTAKQPHKL